MGLDDEAREPRARRVGRGRSAVVVLALLATVAACGTRLPDEAFDKRTDDRSAVGTGGGVGAFEPGTTDGDAPAPTAIDGPSATDGGSTGGGSSGSSGGTPSGGATRPTGPNQASDVGITATTVRIGTIVAENGVLGDTFAPAASGMRSWAEYINAKGGIGGRKVELFTCDDREDRARSLECARRLVEGDKVFALIATNTRALGGAATYLQQQGVPVLGNPINNSFYRFSHFFTVYGTPVARDNQQVGRSGQLVSYSTNYRWFKENLNATKAAVFNYDVAESNQAGAFLEAGLKAEGFAVKRYTVSFAAPAFDAAVAEMQRDGTEVIFDGMDPGANRRLCDAMARRNFTVKGKVSTIPQLGDSAGEELNDTCRPVSYVAGDSQVYTDDSVPFIKAYNDAMDRYQRGKAHHQWGLEAWVMATMLEQGLLQMGPAPTRKGFEEFLLSKQEWDVNGVMTPTLGWTYDAAGLASPTVRDCIAVAKWSDERGGWVSAAPFPYCQDDSAQFFTPSAEQGT